MLQPITFKDQSPVKFICGLRTWSSTPHLDLGLVMPFPADNAGMFK